MVMMSITIWWFNNILTIDNKTNEYIESFFIHITDELKNITKIFND